MMVVMMMGARETHANMEGGKWRGKGEMIWGVVRG